MFFQQRTSIRLSQDQEIIINKIIRNNPEKYFNKSHFIRVAIIQLIKREEKLK